MPIELRNEIATKANITFPRPMSFVKTEKLLYYISTEIHGDVSCDLVYPRSFNYNKEEKKSEFRLKERTMREIHIKKTENCSLSAQLYSPKEDISSFSSLKLDMLVYYNKNDLEVLQLGYKVRNIVDDYFKKLLKEENL